jgi:hypothetical protein
MTLIRKTAALLLLALAGFSAAAQTPVNRELAEQLLRKSGTWVQLADIGLQVRAGTEQAGVMAGQALSADVQERLGNAAEAAYAPARLRELMLAAVAADLSPADAVPLLAWYNSPLGKKIVALEEVPFDPNVDPATLLQAKTQAYAQASRVRQAALKRLSTVIHAAEFNANITVGVMLGVQQGFMGALPDEPGPSLAERRASIESLLPQLVKMMEMPLLATYARMYRSLGDAEFTKYINFLSSPAGQRFNTLLMQAMDKAMTECARDLGRQLPSTRSSSNT